MLLFVFKLKESTFITEKSKAPLLRFLTTVGMSAAKVIRLWLLPALLMGAVVAGNPDAKRLYDDLLSNYNKLVRPVVNTSDVLKVCIKLKLSQLIDVVSLKFA